MTAGITRGMALSDARAIHPALTVRPHDPDGDAHTLKRLAEWCVRYTPWAAPDPESLGVWLDITGCAHLIGGEDALARDLTTRLETAGYHVRLAIADTPGAAWAAARYLATGARPAILPVGDVDDLDPLPTRALRLADDLLSDLDRLGLRTVGDVRRMPRAALQRRFGPSLALRLDQLNGDAGEPISPLRPVPELRSRLAFAEPIGLRDDIDEALTRLLDDLEARLEAQSQGVRRLALTAFRADGTTQRIIVGTSRPVRDPRALQRLFRDKLDGIEPGYGIDLMMLDVLASGVLIPKQQPILSKAASPSSGMSDPQRPIADRGTCQHEDIAPLVDRLANRLGPGNVNRFEMIESHVPERAYREQSLVADVPGRALPRRVVPEAIPMRAVRPLRLLPVPVLIDVIAPVPDHPPLMFRWQRRAHRIRHAVGPERIGPEWWREDMALDAAGREPRDYYTLEDEDGLRFWVYREGIYRPDRAPRWLLHGYFG